MQLDIAALAAAYRKGDTTPAKLIAGLQERIRQGGLNPVWIALVEGDAMAQRLARLEERRAAGEPLPLYGIPFAVKDNIDVEGVPTTAACPAFAYRPERSASVVRRLEAAGAIPIGKTNLDQFATGLVGTRSPHGAPSSVFHKDYISGGSSSGSAVAVASGLAAFSLGTDTAGSGRVPAAFNALVGLKPSKGLLSTQGVVPACRSLDCVSIFARSVTDAGLVLAVAEGFDGEDGFSRARPAAAPAIPYAFCFCVPAGPLDFCGDAESAALYAAAIDKLRALGGHAVEFDYAPFAAAAALLYQGPFVAERLAAVRSYGFEDWAAMDPVVASIIKGAEKWSAADAFRAHGDLASLARQTESVWQSFDVMLLPTAPTIFTHAEIAADPVGRNAKLGLYTNFVNLLDLSALALPAGFRRDGLPFGVTLIAPAFAEAGLLALGERYTEPAQAPVRLAVVGAHLSGQPLNGQLRDRGARLLGTFRTASGYKLYALAGTTPPKPGLMRDPAGAGGIEIELWELASADFGSFVALVPPPLGIGTVELEDGSLVKGFICEAAGLEGARDITAYGGWRAYRAASGGESR
jgi:allophanate hydrolase